MSNRNVHIISADFFKQQSTEELKSMLEKLLDQYKSDIISLGNGPTWKFLPTQKNLEDRIEANSLNIWHIHKVLYFRDNPTKLPYTVSPKQQ